MDTLYNQHWGFKKSCFLKILFAQKYDLSKSLYLRKPSKSYFSKKTSRRDGGFLLEKQHLYVFVLLIIIFEFLINPGHNYFLPVMHKNRCMKHFLEGVGGREKRNSALNVRFRPKYTAFANIRLFQYYTVFSESTCISKMNQNFTITPLNKAWFSPTKLLKSSGFVKDV